VHINPYVGFLEFLSLSRRFDWLIINDASTSSTHSRNPFLPSKFADYRGSGSRIWGLIEPGSPLSELPLDARSVIGDVDGVARVIAEIATSDVRAAHD